MKQVWKQIPFISFFTFGALALSAFIVACGGGHSSSSAQNPTPTITSLSPSSAPVGTSSASITISGSGFLATSSVTFNGVAHTATYVSPTQLTISLATADLATAGTDPVVVTNPAPGGGSSSAVNFTVVANNPVPAITSLSPAFLTAGAASQALTINGTGFLASSTVTFNGASHAATFVSATQLTISLTATDLANAGNYPVVVTNPPPGGGASAGTDFGVWPKLIEPTTGLTFFVPPFGTSNQITVDTSTPGRTFVDFALQNASGVSVGEFVLTVFSNPGGLTLQQWFEQNIDANNVLLSNNAYEQQTLSNGVNALVYVGPIPDAYFAAAAGPPLDSVYAFSSSGQVISIRQAPANDLANYGYTSPQSLMQLKLQVLGTAHF